MIKFRIEGQRDQIQKAIEKLKSIYSTVTVSKFYPNRAMGNIESHDGRVYVDCSD